MTEDEVPEADRLEQEQPPAGEGEERLDLGPEVPEADALEQAGPPPVEDEATPDDADEADVLDQRRSEESDLDEEDRR